jgi:hypothetical protein
VSKFVLEITVRLAALRNNRPCLRTPRCDRKQDRTAAEARNKKRGSGVVVDLFQRAMPLAALAVSLIATVAWVSLLGYVAIKIF